jgi:hypothetical protein
MKQIWPDYSYSPATNVLTLTGLNIDRDQLLLVAAPERGRIMYNFADSSVTASAYTAGANTALTLVASTAGLTTTASLVIYYDDQLQSTAITISNFPATQPVSIASVTVGNTVTIAGTVTANDSGALSIVNSSTVTKADVKFTAIAGAYNPTDFASSYTLRPLAASQTGKLLIDASSDSGGGSVVGYDGSAFIRIAQSPQSVVTIGSLPAISGTVTANLDANSPVIASQVETGIASYAADLANDPLPISGTVTVGNSVTIGSLPAISGTVTANLSISSTVITSGSFSSLSSATLVPENPARKMATVFNLGAGQLFINAGVTATTLGGGFMVALSSGDYYEVPNHQTTITHSAMYSPPLARLGWTQVS